jgi:hypothetical protein
MVWRRAGPTAEMAVAGGGGLAGRVQALTASEGRLLCGATFPRKGPPGSKVPGMLDALGQTLPGLVLRDFDT